MSFVQMHRLKSESNLPIAETTTASRFVGGV
jgi:hypothetical protein